MRHLWMLSIGHCHPVVSKAAADQTMKVVHAGVSSSSSHSGVVESGLWSL